MRLGTYVFIEDQRHHGVGVLVRVVENQARVHFYDDGILVDVEMAKLKAAPAGVFNKEGAND